MNRNRLVKIAKYTAISIVLFFVVIMALSYFGRRFYTPYNPPPLPPRFSK